MKDFLCPCDSEIAYSACCGKYIEQGISAPNAEALMRSRYTAYTQCNVTYLLKTWFEKTRPELDEKVLGETVWTGLEVIEHKPGLKRSLVEFKAQYVNEHDQEAVLHERSTFKKVKNRWYYVDGDFPGN